MILQDAQGRPIVLGAVYGRGGEATIFRIENDPGSLAKIYEPAPRANYASKLAWMVAHPPENPTAKSHHDSLAWPEALLFDASRSLRGYRMPLAAQAVHLLEVFNPRRRAMVLPKFDRRYLHRTASNLALALGALHSKGYVAGDINESNILVTREALVTIIDTDSFQVREQRGSGEIVHRCPVGKPEYIPPELQGVVLSEQTRDANHDAFALAVLIFQLLMEGSHPFRAQWLGQGDPPPLEKRIQMGAFPYVEHPAYPVAPPRFAPGLETLHPNLADLFRRCFVDGQRSPRWRPGPDLWVRVLRDAEKALVKCSQDHLYANHLAACPYCALLQKHPDVATARPASARPAAWAARSQPVSVPAAVPPRGTRAAPGRPMGSVGQALRSWPARSSLPGIGAARGSQVPPLSRSSFYLRPAAVRDRLRQTVIRSIRYGVVYGALAGAAAGGLVAVFDWAVGSPLDWSALVFCCGAASGILRGWKPARRFAMLAGVRVGWERFLRVIGVLLGGTGGALFGMFIESAMLPILLGLFAGGVLGGYVAGKIWRSGSGMNWERFWGVLMAALLGLIGWIAAWLANTMGLSALGAQLAVGLQPYAYDGSLLAGVAWLLGGGFGGAMFGALAGGLVDVLGRIARLAD